MNLQNIINKNVLRKIEGATPQQRRQFRAAEATMLESLGKGEVDKDYVYRNRGLVNRSEELVGVSEGTSAAPHNLPLLKTGGRGRFKWSSVVRN